MVALGILLLATVSCRLFRPSVEEVRTELTRLIDPALDAGLGEVKRPKGHAGGSSCYEPIIGPKYGIRPRLGYTFPLSILDGDPETFLDKIEDHWRKEGLAIRIDETENARILFTGKDGYNISAAIIYGTMEADIGGSGPCVDDPNPP